MGKRFGPKCYAFMSFYARFTIIVMWLGGTLFAGGALFGAIAQLGFYAKCLGSDRAIGQLYGNRRIGRRRRYGLVSVNPHHYWSGGFIDYRCQSP